MNIDKKIKTLRHIYQQLEDDDLSMSVLRELNKLQRQRYSETGKFLLHSNGKLFTFSILDKSWYRWDSK